MATHAARTHETESAGAPATFSFPQLCRELGKSPLYVRTLQQKVGLFAPPRGQRLKQGYLNFLKRVISLRTFNVPLTDIAALFTKERKILEMLHFDTIHREYDWYLETANGEERTERHLLLTGQDLGFPIDAPVIQSNLDFQRREDELFGRAEMGEDVGRALESYRELYLQIRRRVQQEEQVLENALIWAEQALWNPKNHLREG